MSIKTKPLKITSEAKHTPGPWEIDDSKIKFAINAPSKHIAMVNIGPGKQWLEENKANAHLIASAPDLKRECDLAADALDWTIEQLQDNVPLAPWALGLIDGLMARMKSLEAVLARAEGKGE